MGRVIPSVRTFIDLIAKTILGLTAFVASYLLLIALGFVFAFWQLNRRAEEGEEAIQSHLHQWSELNLTETTEALVLCLIVVHLFTLLISNGNDRFESVMDRREKASYYQLALFLLDLELLIFWKKPRVKPAHLIFGKYRPTSPDNSAGWRHQAQVDNLAKVEGRLIKGLE